MKLIAKLFIFLIGVIIIPIILVISYTYMDIKTSITNIEVDKGQAYMKSTNEYIGSLISNQNDGYDTWTHWTEYYDAVKSRDIQWLNDNIYDSSSGKILITLDINGNILSSYDAPKDWNLSNLKNLDIFKKVKQSSNYTSALVIVSNRLYITSVIKLVKAEDKNFTNPDGYVLYARPFQNDLLINGKKIMGADISIKLANETLSTAKKPIPFIKTEFNSFNNKDIETYTHVVGNTMDIQAEQILKDVSGNPIGILQIKANSKAGVSSLKKLEANSFALVVILMLSVGLVCLLISRTILRPLSIIVREAKQIADGNLITSKDVAVKLEKYTRSKDEIGQFTRAFKIMKTNLKTMIGNVRDSSNELARLSGGMAEAAKSNDKVSEQIASATVTIASGASAQNENVNNISLQIEASVRKTEEGFNTADKMLDEARKSSSIAENGRNYMYKVIDEFNEVSEGVEFATNSIQKLSAKSEEMSGIINVITGVAAQTNLLALNASIEAARAGEAGKGFSVVADEIRKLSDSTSVAAKAITELIRETNSETVITLNSMENNLEKVKTQIDAIRKGGEALDKIVLTVKETENDAMNTHQIYQHIQDMSNSINTAIAHISGIISDNAAYTEEVAASTSEQSFAMESIAKDSAGLALLAEKLKSEVNKFKSEDL